MNTRAAASESATFQRSSLREPGVKRDEGGVMVDPQIQGSNTEKNPDEWVTGDEPMTGAQAAYLRTLTQEAGEDFDESMSKADASKRIDELQEKTGRGQ